MDVRQLVGGRPSGQRGQQIVSAYVSTEQPAPTGFDNPMYVVIPSHSTEISYPLPWLASHGNTKPAQGAACLVAYDENNTPYVIWWAGEHS